MSNKQRKKFNKNKKVNTEGNLFSFLVLIFCVLVSSSLLHLMQLLRCHLFAVW